MKTERPFASIRRSRGLSLNRASAKLGISPKYLRALETGQAHLAWPLAVRMGRTYGVDCGQLVRTPGSGGKVRRGASRATRPAAHCVQRRRDGMPNGKRVATVVGHERGAT